MTRFTLLVALLISSSAWAAEVIPPSPPQYFNDYANVTSAATRQQVNQQLVDFERQTSNQLVVAVYPKMQSDSSVEDYTVRVAEKWRVGQTLHKNGIVLFVFVQDRKLWIQVGYGLEGALPDALCRQIIDNDITPRFKEKNYEAGLTAGVAAIIAATKNEYHGTGATKRNSQSAISNVVATILIILIIVFVFVMRMRGLFRSAIYYGSGGRGYYGGSWGGGWSSGGSWGGGSGGGGGGGGGFSGGGGSFGGGGAGGSW